MRWSLHGAQQLYGVVPDLSTWGKALANGFAVSASRAPRVASSEGSGHPSPGSSCSHDHGPEAAGLAAYLAVVKEYRSWDVVGTMERQGRLLAEGVRTVVRDAVSRSSSTVHGHPACLVFGTADPDGRPSQAFRTLFLQELLRRGVLGSRSSSRPPTRTPTSTSRSRRFVGPCRRTRGRSRPVPPTVSCTAVRSPRR